MFLGKKGTGFEEFVPLLIFLFVAGASILFVMTQDSAKADTLQKDLGQAIDEAQAEQNLLLFLSGQRDTEREPISVALLLESAYHSGDFHTFHEASKDFFHPIYQERWVLEVEDSPGEVIYSASQAISRPGGRLPSSSARSKVASVTFPIGGKEPSHLTVNLFVIS